MLIVIDIFLLFVNQLKERAEKLEIWRMQAKKHEDKKAEKKESLHKQSLLWVDEAELEKEITNVVIATTYL